MFFFSQKSNRPSTSLSVSVRFLCRLDQWSSSMLNLITGSAERSSPGACDHLSGSFFSLSLSLVRGYFHPLRIVRSQSQCWVQRVMWWSQARGGAHLKKRAHKATRDVSPIRFFVWGIQWGLENVSKSLIRPAPLIMLPIVQEQEVSWSSDSVWSPLQQQDYVWMLYSEAVGYICPPYLLSFSVCSTVSAGLHLN